ncbi:hypothetical protein ACS15_4095 [Ralstonia insidiosa]|uniref:Uncharacterized protein n=1 Tax=Ralstonia insidiosa TaxID=190721 RepID=A0AAC9FU34_9RALS|nr:hypothetical protein ACS15_4095 [Ralstonia insidiosa]
MTTVVTAEANICATRDYSYSPRAKPIATMAALPPSVRNTTTPSRSIAHAASD